jgi:hypothetical protein
MKLAQQYRWQSNGIWSFSSQLFLHISDSNSKHSGVIMDKPVYPRLVLPEEYDDLDWSQITEKGWFEAEVELENSGKYKLNYYDPIRLKQDIDYYLSKGERYFDLPNLVVLPEITLNTIKESIRSLWEKGSFELFKPE